MTMGEFDLFLAIWRDRSLRLSPLLKKVSRLRFLGDRKHIEQKTMREQIELEVKNWKENQKE